MNIFNLFTSNCPTCGFEGSRDVYFLITNTNTGKINKQNVLDKLSIEPGDVVTTIEYCPVCGYEYDS